MESYIVTITRRKGVRKVRRHGLNVPLDCATGNYKALSDRALNDLRKDLLHEYRRRNRLPLDQTYDDMTEEIL